MPTRNRTAGKRYTQLADEILPFSHSWQPYCDEHSTTVSSVEVVDADSGMTVSGSLTNNVYTGTLTASQQGTYHFSLAATMADASKPYFEFEVEVTERGVW